MKAEIKDGLLFLESETEVEKAWLREQRDKRMAFVTTPSSASCLEWERVYFDFSDGIDRKELIKTLSTTTNRLCDVMDLLQAENRNTTE